PPGAGAGEGHVHDARGVRSLEAQLAQAREIEAAPERLLFLEIARDPDPVFDEPHLARDAVSLHGKGIRHGSLPYFDEEERGGDHAHRDDPGAHPPPGLNPEPQLRTPRADL